MAVRSLISCSYLFIFFFNYFTKPTSVVVKKKSPEWQSMNPSSPSTAPPHTLTHAQKKKENKEEI